MAYDFVVGKSNLVKDNPDLLDGIEFDMYPTIVSLQKRADSGYLLRGVAN